MSVHTLWNYRLRIGLLLALLFALAAGIFTAAQAQGQVCRDVKNISVCGDRIVEFERGNFRLEGNIKIGQRGVPPMLEVRNIENDPLIDADPNRDKLRQPSFTHFTTLGDMFGSEDTIRGAIHLIGDPNPSPIARSVAVEDEGIILISDFLVDANNPRIFNAPEGKHDPIELGLLRNQNLRFEFLQRAGFSPDFEPEGSIQFTKIDIEFDMNHNTRKFNAVIPLKIGISNGGTSSDVQFATRVQIDDRGILTQQTDSFKVPLGGLTGEVKGVNIGETGSPAPQAGDNGSRQAGDTGFNFTAEAIEFRRADNPGLPNLDASAPDLVFRLEGLEYKDGRFRIRGGTAKIKDWTVGSAFKLINQQVTIRDDEKTKSAELVISSTLSFPAGSAATDTRAFPMNLRVRGVQQPNGSTTASITGTLLANSPPALNLGPLKISAPGNTSLIFDQQANFFGLSAQQVTIQWDGKLGGGTGIQSGFKLGVDRDKKLVFSLGAGGQVRLPDIRSKAFTLQLSGSLSNAQDVTTFTINGTARLALPGNGTVAPGVTMLIRGGKGVQDSCRVGQTGCLKRFEYRLSSFNLKLGGFGIGITNAQGTADGGFAVESAKLTVPLGIKSIGGEIKGLTITGAGDVQVTGGGFELPPLQIGSFSLVGVKGSFVKNATGYEFKGSGTVPLPGLEPNSGKKISGEVIIRTKSDGSLQGAGVTVAFDTGAPGIPIANTGMELTRLSGTFDVNAGTVKLSVGMRASSSLRIASLPLATAEGNATLQLNPFQLTANAKVSLLILDVAQASMGIGHQQGFAGGSGFNVAFSLDLVLVRGDTSLRIGPLTLSDGRRVTNVAATASYRVGIKKNQIIRFVPPVDINVASVEFKGGRFRVKNGPETLGLLGRVKVSIPLLPDPKFSVFVDMNGPKVDVTDTDKYSLIDAATVRARAARGVPGYGSRTLDVSATRALGLTPQPNASVLQDSVPVLIEQPGFALFGIAFAEGSPNLRLQLPDGTILTGQNVDGERAGFLRDPDAGNGEQQLAFMLENAQPGTYTMLIDNAPSVYEKVSYVLNAEPTIASATASCAGQPLAGLEVRCDGAPAGSQVNISWSAADADSPEARVAVGYALLDATGAAKPGELHLIAEDQPLQGNLAWDLADVPGGRYRVVVSVADGKNAPVESLASLVVEVADQRAPAQPSGLKADPLPGELLIGWTPNVERDLAGYEIGFGIVEPGQEDSPERFIYSRDMGAKEVSIGSSVFDGKLWGLEDNQEVFVGIRAYDLSGNKSGWTLVRARPWALAPNAWNPVPDGVGAGNVEVAFATALNLDPAQPLPAGLLEVKRGDGSLVAGRLEPLLSVEEDAVVGLRFVPDAPLREGARYSATVRGGPSGVVAADGRIMPADYSWSFTIGAAQAPGGPAGIYLPLTMR